MGLFRRRDSPRSRVAVDDMFEPISHIVTKQTTQKHWNGFCFVLVIWSIRSHLIGTTHPQRVEETHMFGTLRNHRTPEVKVSTLGWTMLKSSVIFGGFWWTLFSAAFPRFSAVFPRFSAVPTFRNFLFFSIFSQTTPKKQFNHARNELLAISH